jgi:hypothetical protein
MSRITRLQPFAGVALRLAVVLLVAGLLAGCGKKGNPQPPTDQPNTYPTPYPRA